MEQTVIQADKVNTITLAAHARRGLKICMILVFMSYLNVATNRSKGAWRQGRLHIIPCNKEDYVVLPNTVVL